MNDEKIYKISLITTIIGLVGIMLLSGYVNPETVTINQIDKSKIDNQVELDATVLSVSQTRTNTQIIKLGDKTGTINLVIFSSVDFKTKLSNNQHVRVIAKVTQYNNDLELILEESKNLNIS